MKTGKERISTTCSICKTGMSCTSDANCWCHELPHIEFSHLDSSCLCRACLLQAQALRVNEGLPLTLEVRLQIMSLDTPQTATVDIDYTMEGGLLVMTKWFLLRRGHCCKNGCRHSPYSDD